MSRGRQKKRVLITLGPTRAYLDSVRFLSNYSTGELGIEIIKALLKNNFEVAAVSGPISFNIKNAALKKIDRVITVDEMRESTLSLCHSFKPDYFLPTAAVLDFVPKKTQKGKTSSQRKIWKVELVPTKKIIDEVQKEHPKIKMFGFKLEVGDYTTSQIRTLASKIITEKKLVGLCLNFLNEINSKQHPAYIFANEASYVRVNSKKEIAKRIVKILKGLAENGK